jgi:hypothetical protein
MIPAILAFKLSLQKASKKPPKSLMQNFSILKHHQKIITSQFRGAAC